MKLTKVAESNITEDSGASLRKRIAEHEREKKALQVDVDHGTEDYKLVVAGSRKLSSEHDQLKICCEGL
jgi:hypothetical protein